MIGQKTRGTLCGIGAAVCYGMNPLGAKFLYAAGLTPDSVLFYRYLFAALLLGGFLLVKRESLRVTLKEALVLGALGVLFAISSLTFFESFELMDTGLACTLLFVYPVMVALIMALCFHERLRWMSILAIALGLGGVLLLCRTSGGESQGLGILLVMISSLAYALYIVVVNRAKLALSASKLTFYVMAVCIPCVFIHLGVSGAFVPQALTSAPMVGWALMLALVPTVFSLVLMALAVRLIGSTPTAVMGALEPVTAVLIGITLFGESLTGRLLVGIGLILSAVTLIVLGKAQTSK